MCWKYEWAMAVNNLNHAIIHMKRARRKIHARLLRNERHLKKLEKLNYTSQFPRVKELIEKNREGERQCRQLIADFKKKQDHLRRLLNTYGIKRSKKSRMAEKLMKGKRIKTMVR